jgi:hypothetical protein
LKSHAAVLTFFAFALSTMHVRADQLTVLGTANTYGLLAASTITSTGATVVSGDLGLYGTSVTGFLPGVVTKGAMHIGDSQAQIALADAENAFSYLSGLATTQTLTGQELAGMTLGPGVYFFSSSAALNGALTLDFQGMGNRNIVFLVGSSFTTSDGSSISVVNQGLDDNVFYVVGSSATLGTNSIFAGDIIAGGGVDLGIGAGSSCGSVIALTGAVTMLSNNIKNCSSTGSNVTPYLAESSTNLSFVPELGTFPLFATGVGLLSAAVCCRPRTPLQKQRL